MGAEKVVAMAQREDRELGRARMRRAPKGFDRWLLRCTGAPGLVLGAFGIAALGLSCRGRLSDACDGLGTCAPSARADASVEASSDASSCDPTMDPKDEPCVLDSAYGVFVASAGSDAGAGSLGSGVAGPDGTAERPYASIGQAMANLGSKMRIYVCNGLYTEQVNVTAPPVSLFGGLSCAAGSSGPVWTYVGGSAQVTSPSPGYALSVTGVSSGGVTIEDLSFTSPSATAPGGSSVAAWIASSTVSLKRVTLSAGTGANGANGSTPSNYTGLAPAGGPQVWIDTSGVFRAISGGTGASNQCLRSGSSAGGQGGLGCGAGLGSPGLGAAGTAIPEAPGTLPGRDGLPMGAVVLVDGGTPVTVAANDPGADGLAGDSGVAVPAQTYGTLSLSGWTASAGGDGANGDPGQGGAGATDPLYGRCGTPAQSLGGGGGGAGGCGGSGGQGGGGGGASIALAIVASTVDLKGCFLITAGAGTGGAGGAGQDGQAGGPGGDASFGSNPHAPGAAGGNGAGGAGGAGGTGGISVGILSAGSTITSDMASQSPMLGSSGAGGAPGAPGRHPTGGALTTGTDGNPGARGSPGTSVAVLSLM